jgi:hypothetical protein
MSPQQVIVVAKKLSVRVSGTIQIEVKCPFCDRPHYHGAGFKLDDIKHIPFKFGTRCPDCPADIPLRDYSVEWDFVQTILYFENEECGHKFLLKMPQIFTKNLFSIVPLLLPTSNIV